MRAVRSGAAWRARGEVVLAALVLVLADAAKPLAVDDPAYVAFARQIVAHPADPYGFEIYWGQDPQPAFDVLAPPLLPYWIAGSMALLGDEPLRWKLALLPFALAFAASLRRLLARFAPGLETPLLWMAVLSPSVLPFLNLMLDVPAASLSLLALALFLAACERPSLALSVAAGLVGGLAMQTKYTGATAVAAMLAWGLLCARLRLAVVAAAVAAGVFWGWEGLMALRYGQSHLVQGILHLWPQRYGVSALAALVWSLGLLTILGAVAPAVGTLGLAALGLPARAVAGAALAVAACFAAVPLLPAAPLPEPELWPRLRGVPPQQWIFSSLGVATAATVLRVASRRLRSGAPEGRFLVAWLAIEVAGFAALSPFLAARRVIGIALASLVLCGHAVHAELGGEAARRALRVPLALGAALGLLFAASDFADAVAVRDAVRATSRRIEELGARGPRATTWYLGHWGFQFYAERDGMRPVAAGRTRLDRGDWLVVAEGVSKPSIRAPGASPRSVRVAVRSASPWSTSPWSYMGPIPISPRSAAQVRVSIHRVLRSFVPPREEPTPPPPPRLPRPASRRVVPSWCRASGGRCRGRARPRSGSPGIRAARGRSTTPRPGPPTRGARASSFPPPRAPADRAARARDRAASRRRSRSPCRPAPLPCPGAAARAVPRP
jgi:hypothetical protein